MCAQLVEAPAVPPVVHIKLAFFTIGDTRDANSPTDLQLTIEEMWQRRAELLAPGRAHGVQNLAAAEAVIDGLADNELIEQVFFLGHGSGQDSGFFFFSGHPDPQLDFTANNDNQVLEISRHDMMHILPDPNPNKDFLLNLIGKLSRSVPLVKINFLACFMGQGETHEAICDFLEDWLVGLSEVKFEVGAFRNFYETVFITDRHGNIVHFEDHIVDRSTTPTTEVVENPGPNQIPPFEAGCSGKMVRTPFLFKFSLSVTEADLDKEEITSDMEMEFSLNKRSLGDDAKLNKLKDGRWEILDLENGVVYRILNESGDLNVYQP